MYIIGKRKDYYDGVVGTLGIDRTIVYDRDTQILEDDDKFPKAFQRNKTYDRKWKNRFFHHFTSLNDSEYSHNSMFYVGFCGKIYVGWKFYREMPHPDRFSVYPTDLETYITYDREFIKNNVNGGSWQGNLVDILNFIDTYNSMDIFRELKSPAFVYDGDYNRTYLNNHDRLKSVFIINPILSDYEFYKIFDTFNAFQEISMFIGGVLGCSEKNIVEVEDKYKITQHGFNKWSFRKEPEKKN